MDVRGAHTGTNGIAYNIAARAPNGADIHRIKDYMTAVWDEQTGAQDSSMGVGVPATTTSMISPITACTESCDDRGVPASDGGG